MPEDFICTCGSKAKDFKPVLTTISTPSKKIVMNWLKCPNCKKEYLAKKETFYKLHIISKEGEDYEMDKKNSKNSIPD